MIIYSLVFLLLYTAVAYLSSSAITYFLLSAHLGPPYRTTEVVYMIAISVAQIVLHYIFFQKAGKKHLSKPLVIALAIIDFILFGCVFFMLMGFMVWANWKTLLKIIFPLEPQAIAFWILIIILGHRIWVTKRFFSRNKTG